MAKVKRVVEREFHLDQWFGVGESAQKEVARAGSKKTEAQMRLIRLRLRKKVLGY